MELIEEGVFKFGIGFNIIIFLIEYIVIFIFWVVLRDSVGFLFWKELRNVKMKRKKRWVFGIYN